MADELRVDFSKIKGFINVGPINNMSTAIFWDRSAEIVHILGNIQFHNYLYNN